MILASIEAERAIRLCEHMKVDWEELRRLMLMEPKPAMSFVISETGLSPSRSGRVLHDGGSRWLIWSSEKLELNDGARAVVISDETSTSHESSELHSHGWIKSLAHPRLTNIEDGEAVTAAGVHEGECAGVKTWRVDVNGLRDNEDTVFTIDVEKESGIILALARKDPDVRIELLEFELEAPIPEALFGWVAAQDSDRGTA